MQFPTTLLSAAGVTALVAAGTLFILFLTAALLVLAARMVGVENPTLRQGMRAAVLGWIPCVLLCAVFSAVPVAGPVFGALAALLVQTLILKRVFGATFEEALGTAVFAGVLGAFSAGALTLLCTVAVPAAFRLLH